jgi:hypothetical protein
LPLLNIFLAPFPHLTPFTIHSIPHHYLVCPSSFSTSPLSILSPLGYSQYPHYSLWCWSSLLIAHFFPTYIMRELASPPPWYKALSSLLRLVQHSLPTTLLPPPLSTALYWYNTQPTTAPTREE